MSVQPTIPVLGYQFWWSLKGIKVTRSELQNALEKVGLGAYLPEPISAQTALRRALVELLKERGAALNGSGEDADDDSPGVRKNRTTRDLIRPINARRNAWMVFAIVGEQVDFQELGLSYGTQARILLEKLDPAERGRRKPNLLCTTEERGIIAAEDEARALGDALRPRWEYYQELYLSTDLSRMVREIVDAIPHVVCIRREGGLYFVPQSQHAQLVQLQTLIERLPTDGSAEPYCMVIGLPDEQGAKRELARAIHQGFVAELHSFGADLADLRTKAKSIKPETIAGRLAAFKELRAKAETYADLLDMQQEQILSQVAALRRQAQALLDANADDDDPETDVSGDRAA